MSTNFGDRIYRVSMQLVTMKDVVNEARILENVDADINLVAMFSMMRQSFRNIFRRMRMISW